MPIRLVKTKRGTFKVLGEGSTQILVEEELIVPDIRPDIASVLRISADPVIYDEKTAENKVQFGGVLNVNIIYLAKDAERLVYSMHDVIAFEGQINIDGVTTQSGADVYAETTHLEYKLINARRISVKAIVTVYTCVMEKVDEEFLQSIEGEEIVYKGCNLPMSLYAENEEDSFIIKESLDVGTNKPQIADIIDCDVSLVRQEVKVVNGGVNVKGDASVSFIYSGAGEDDINTETAEFIIPFNGVVSFPSDMENMEPYVKLSVDKVEYFITQNAEGEDRVIDMEIMINANAGGIITEEITVIEDVYSLKDELDVEMRDVDYRVATGKTEARLNMKENVSLESEDPDIMQVVKAWGKCYLDNVTPKENAVVAEGAIGVQVMYIAKSDEMPVQTAYFLIPYEHSIELKGTTSESKIESSCQIERISINMLTNREVEINCALVINSQAFDVKTKSVVNNVAECERPKAPSASVVIYVVQKGDSLWKIAKRFNTTVDNIAAINDIENPNLIYPGQKILILKIGK